MLRYSHWRGPGSLSLTLIVAALLTACAVGPDFAPQPAPLPASWISTQDDAAVLSTDTPDDAWWERFGDPLLSSLMHRMAQANLDLQTASLRLQQSQAASGVTAAEDFPRLSVEGGASRARSSAEGLLDPSGHSGQAAYGVWQGGLQATWELDLWGRIRRQREAAQARVGIAREARQAASVSLSATLAQAYIRLRGTQSELRIAEENLALLQASLRLTRVRLAHGVATRLEEEQVAAQAASIEARLPGLRQRGVELVNAISLLLAEPPQALAVELRLPAEQQEVAIPGIALPVAVGLPSLLAKRRPDIGQAQQALRAATAEMGVAQADFYPRITLSGSFGAQAMQLADLGSWNARSFSLGPSVSLPLFDGGRLRAMLELRTLQQREAALQYRKTVLAAWHEVDNAISAWRAAASTRDRLGEALAHSRAAWESAQAQYLQGSADYLHVLTAQENLLRNQSALSASRVSVSLALVDLYRSLGGGWQHELPLKSTRTTNAHSERTAG